MFKLGILGLEERAVVESLFWKLVRGIADLNRGKKRLPRETRDLGDKIADQYMANFSLFQSAPDHWAFDQLFPIVPLHRMEEVPTKDCTIVDITCDSDGKIDRFIENDGVDETLSLHALLPGRAVLPRHVHDRRLPGHHGRHAQPVRPGERDPRVRGRRGSGGLLHRGGHPRRHHREGALARAVRARRALPPA